MALDLPPRGGVPFLSFFPLRLRVITPASEGKASTTHATTWMKPKDVLESATGQAQQDKCLWLLSHDGSEGLKPGSGRVEEPVEGLGQRGTPRGA